MILNCLHRVIFCSIQALMICCCWSAVKQQFYLLNLAQRVFSGNICTTGLDWSANFWQFSKVMHVVSVFSSFAMAARITSNWATFDGLSLPLECRPTGSRQAEQNFVLITHWQVSWRIAPQWAMFFVLNTLRLSPVIHFVGVLVWASNYSHLMRFLIVFVVICNYCYCVLILEEVTCNICGQSTLHTHC